MYILTFNGHWRNYHGKETSLSQSSIGTTCCKKPEACQHSDMSRENLTGLYRSRLITNDFAGSIFVPRENHMPSGLASGTCAHRRRATCTLRPAPLFEAGVRAPWAHSTVFLMYAVASRRGRRRRLRGRGRAWWRTVCTHIEKQIWVTRLEATEDTCCGPLSQHAAHTFPRHQCWIFLKQQSRCACHMRGSHGGTAHGGGTSVGT